MRREPRQVSDLILNSSRVRSLAKTRVFGQGVFRYLSKTTSTNDVAQQMILSGAAHGSVVVAESQAIGRGRLDREWVSPAGVGIYVTLVIRSPHVPLHKAPLLTLLAAVAAVEAIHEMLPALDVSIKWPNDILVNQCKVAGILAEMIQHDQTHGFLIGLGINVNTPKARLPKRPLFPASSLMLEAGQRVDRDALLAHWLERAEHWFTSFENQQDAQLLDAWNQAAYAVGRRVVVNQQNQRLSGTILGVEPDGSLLLSGDTGEQLHIFSGDIQYLDQF